MKKAKNLSHKSLLGQLGANFIERVVSEMGQVWRPTAVHDTGIDGMVEFRDPTTGDVYNRYIQVQSKATSGSFESESSDSFVYRIREEDLIYWLRGNLPVILVVSRPATNEAYWVSIKHYFREQKVKASRKIEFNKNKDRFDKDALPQLMDLAISEEKGIYKPPLRREEELVSNLLQVRSYQKALYIAETPFRKRKDLNAWLSEHGGNGKREWILKNERIFSFYDLREYPWTEVVDQETVEDFDSREWADSDDESKMREWVELLNTCLRSKLFRENIRFQHESQFRFFYFLPNRDGKPRLYRYQSQQKETQREVVKPLVNKKTGELFCFRHSAMETRFYRFDMDWYLEVSPTYFYTSDGKLPYLFHGDKLAGIKRLEHNESVLGQLIMWERLLTDRGDILRQEYSMLRFDELLRFIVGQGISDDLWLPVKEEIMSDDENTDTSGGLFL
jgi:hypothetical protein